MKLILGSKSPNRKKVLEDLGFEFEVMDPNIDEKAIRFEDPVQLVKALAVAKAEALLSKITEPSILITTDLVVAYGNEIREKPESPEQARQFLQDLAGDVPIRTVAALCVTNTQTGFQECEADICEIEFEPLPDELINKFVEEGTFMNNAGGWAIQHPDIRSHARFMRGEIESIIGLPKTLLLKLLKNAGYNE